MNAALSCMAGTTTFQETEDFFCASLNCSTGCDQSTATARRVSHCRDLCRASSRRAPRFPKTNSTTQPKLHGPDHVADRRVSKVADLFIS